MAEEPNVVIVLKTCEIASFHLIEEHRRIQSEIYNRINHRQKVMDLLFISGGLFVGATGFVIKKHIDSVVTVAQSPGTLAFLCAATLAFSFVGAILFNNYITYSGHIYTAAMYIVDHIDGEFQKILTHLQSKTRTSDRLSVSLFEWESYLKRSRDIHKFHDRYGDEYLLLVLPFLMIAMTLVLLIAMLYTHWSIGSTWFAGLVFLMGGAVGAYHGRSFWQYLKLRDLRASLAGKAGL
jgi:hypothetical protein